MYVIAYFVLLAFLFHIPSHSLRGRIAEFIRPAYLVKKTNQLSGTLTFLRAEPLVIYKSSLDNSHHPSMLDEYCSMVQYEPHSKLPPCNDCKLVTEGKAARDERFVVRGNAAWRSWKQYC